MTGTNQCQHGRLVTACRLCDDDQEIERLKAQVRVLREALQRYVNHDLLTGTRGKMNEIARAALEAK